ncbi:MAG: prepilin peptidase [Alphaproteobacteria bacterium]|nr:prepilin peptidase [Alphaproteobacteria bacterium]
MILALTFVHAAVLIIAASLFVVAAISDMRAYRIPNAVCALLLTAFPAYVATSPIPLNWKENIFVLAIVFSVGFACFLGNIVGAGDVKLLSVASLWAGPALIGELLMVTAFVGGIESLAITVVRHLSGKKMYPAKKLVKTEVPYGIAISAGGLAVLGMMAHSAFVRLG